MPQFYTVATATGRFLLKSLTHWKVIGKENVPMEGPLIVVANHLSMPDPLIISASISRRIVFMVKGELFHHRRWAFVKNYGAFPVYHGIRSRTALDCSLRLLEKGEVLGIFPEGKRSVTHALDRAALGAASIALRSGAPILPVGLIGSELIKGPGVVFRRPKITVIIGKPFVLNVNENQRRDERLKEATDAIMRHIAEILPQQYQGVYRH
jgi:1-acyl-sn-glycerol-3-phosphate acyltransferase